MVPEAQLSISEWMACLGTNLGHCFGTGSHCKPTFLTSNNGYDRSLATAFRAGCVVTDSALILRLHRPRYSFSDSGVCRE